MHATGAFWLPFSFWWFRPDLWHIMAHDFSFQP
jgi:hypothetical protein